MSIPLEEAPFETYLNILREEGYGEDADLSEMLYVEILTTIEVEPGKTYTREQIMRTPFKNLVAAAEKIMSTVTQQLQKAPPRNPFTGKSMMGVGADKLTADQLNYLAMRQAQLFDEEKARLGMR